MRIDWWTLAFQTVNVLVLVWLLGRFLFRPVADIVARRQVEANRLMDDAEAARREAKAAATAAAEEARLAAARRSDLMQAAATEAAARKAALLDEAREAALKARASADEERRRAQEEADREAGDKASLLAVDIVAKLMGRLPDELRIAPFVPGLVAAVRSLPELDRAALRAQAARGALPVAVPREPTGEERLAFERAIADALGLADVLGVEVHLELAVEPGLLAGLEVRGAETVIRNSLRGDLDSIASELTRHD